MGRYTAVRVLQFVPTVFLIIVFNFLLIRAAPGDPAVIMADDFATPDVIEIVRQLYGLNDAIHVQLWRYIVKVVSGSLGFSYDYDRPVLGVILERLPATLLLILTAQCLGMALGVVAASRTGSPIDLGVTTLISLLLSTVLPERIVSYRHALRNELLPSVTMIGLSLGTAVSGAVFTETGFPWPGIGRLMLAAISKRDKPY